MEGRNIFLEAALAGEPVVNPEDPEDRRELERLERIFFTQKPGKSGKQALKSSPANLKQKPKTETSSSRIGRKIKEW